MANMQQVETEQYFTGFYYNEARSHLQSHDTFFAISIVMKSINSAINLQYATNKLCKLAALHSKMK